MALSADDLLVADEVLAGLKMGAAFDWAGMIAAFESGTTEQKIVNGLILADDVAKVVGIFVPPVAVIANDVGAAITVEQTIVKIVNWLRTQPSTPAKPSLWSRMTSPFTSIFGRKP